MYVLDFFLQQNEKRFLFTQRLWFSKKKVFINVKKLNFI